MYIIGMISQLRGIERDQGMTPAYRDGIADLRRRILDGKTTGDPTLDEVIVFRSEHVFAFADRVRRMEATLSVQAPCPVVVMYGDDGHIASGIANGSRLFFSRLSKEASLPTAEHRMFDTVAQCPRTIDGSVPLGGVALMEPATFAARIYIGRERCAEARQHLLRRFGKGPGEVVDIVHMATQRREERSRDDAYLSAKARMDAERKVRFAAALKMLRDVVAA